MSKTYYVIQHLPSGKFLPHGKKGKPFTHQEPSWHNPRLFHRPQDAKVALGWWLLGKAQKKLSHDWESNHYEEEGIESIPVASRVRSEMRILEVNLKVIGELQ